jgi:hypothetical protein
MIYGIPEPGSYFKVPEDDEPDAEFTCPECHETMDEDDIAPDYFEQTGDDRTICVWCAEDGGRYRLGLRMD